MSKAYWFMATLLWQLRKKLAMRLGKPVPMMPGGLNPKSPNYIDPEAYGCKPGVVTWEYLNASYYQTFPEERTTS